MSAERFAPARFLRRVRGVPEPQMRAALWRECFDHLEAEPLARVVVAVLDALERKEEAGRLGYFSLLRVLEQAPRDDLLKLSAGGRAIESSHINDLLLRFPPMRTAEPAELRNPPLDPDRDVTLGERRAWARRPDREVLARLLYDQDVGVIRILLDNPRLIEQDVLRIASRRPSSAQVLASVFRHVKWGRRATVREALAFNPYTPTEIASGLVDVVELEVARRLASEPGVHPVVRARARARMGRR